MNPKRLSTIVVGISMLVFGANQIKNPSAWRRYVPEWLKVRLPFNLDTLLRIHASGNVAIGMLLLSGKMQKLTLRLAGAWWIWVAPFCGRFDWRTGIRDLTVGGLLIAASKAKKGLT